MDFELRRNQPTEQVMCLVPYEPIPDAVQAEIEKILEAAEVE